MKTALFLSAAFLAVLLNAEMVFLPHSGNWNIRDGAVMEKSDSAAVGNRPLWTLTGDPSRADYALKTTVKTDDGMGDVYLAVRWKNADNYYALRFSDPHSVLSLLQVKDGVEHVLISRENAAGNPQKAPLELTLEAIGGRLIGRAGNTQISAAIDDLTPGNAALGARYRKVDFQRVTLTEVKAPEELTASLRPLLPGMIFRRGELPRTIPFAVSVSGKNAGDLKLKLELALNSASVQNFSVSNGSEVKYALPAEGLKAGDYHFRYQLRRGTEALGGGVIAFTVAPSKNPQQFEILLWDSIDQFSELKKLGFTAAGTPFFRTSDYVRNPEAHLRETVAALRRAESGMKYGVSSILKLDTRRFWDKQKYAHLLAKGPNQTIQLKGEICQNHPEYRKLMADSLHALGKKLQNVSNINYILHDSETENEERKLFPCSHSACREKGKSASFAAPPVGMERVWGAVGASLYANAKKAGAGEDRIVPDDNLPLNYLKWWWLDGSGFVNARAEQSAVMKQYLPRARSFHDPILRAPAFLGRDRGMDFVSQWTYTNPSPLGVLENIDEMSAAVDGKKPIVPDIQLFWYSNEVAAPLKSQAERQKQTENTGFVEARDAVHFGRFLTISPDHLTEAVWLAMSRPIAALMFDGGSAVSTTPGTYAFTNPDTPRALENINRTLVIPYGPMLKAMTGTPKRAAILQSVTSSLFGRTGNYGNANGFFADVYNSAVLSQLEVQILFSENLLTQLDGFDLLIVPETKYLTRAEADAIAAFAKRGKLVVADQTQGPEMPFAARMTFLSGAGKTALEQNQIWCENAKNLKTLLQKHAYCYAVSTNAPEVIVSRRLGDGDQTIFLINDLRHAGTYVGQYGKVLENLTPRTVKVHFADEFRTGGRTVYDVMERRELKFSEGAAELHLFAGKLLYVAQSRITGLDLNVAPENTERGNTVRLRLAYRSENGLRGSQALRIRIFDPNGVENEYSGYYAAGNGVFELTFPLAANDLPGIYRVEAEDLIANFRAQGSFSCR